MSEPTLEVASVKARSELLISAAELAEEINNPDLKIIDATTHLVPSDQGGFGSVSGWEDYQKAHIAGAQFFDLQGELSDQVSEYRFTVPPVEQFETRMSKAGITSTDKVVIYASNHPMWACRMWWLLSTFGHPSVRVLDGGLQAWRAQGYPVTSEVPVVELSHYEATFNGAAVIDGAGLVASDTNQLCVLNALSASQYKGEGPHYGRPGHISGSKNTPYSAFLDDKFCFRDNSALSAIFKDSGVSDDRTVVTYCGGGIAACIPIFALAMLGRQDRVRLYDHSLSEWAANPQWPMSLDRS